MKYEKQAAVHLDAHEVEDALIEYVMRRMSTPGPAVECRIQSGCCAKTVEVVTAVIDEDCMAECIDLGMDPDQYIAEAAEKDRQITHLENELASLEKGGSL